MRLPVSSSYVCCPPLKQAAPNQCKHHSSVNSQMLGACGAAHALARGRRDFHDSRRNPTDYFLCAALHLDSRVGGIPPGRRRNPSAASTGGDLVDRSLLARPPRGLSGGPTGFALRGLTGGGE